MHRRLAAALVTLVAASALAAPGASGADAPAVADLPIVPRIDAAMKERLRAVLAHGAELGNRPAVFAKVGDSITAGSAFLSAIDCDRPATWGEFGHLQATVAFYREQEVPRPSVPCAPTSSFGRSSRAAVPGWTVEDVMERPAAGSRRAGCKRGEAPLACEYRELAPAVAIVMYGTNDVGYTPDPTAFREGLRGIVRASVERGVIPILSTIPPRLDSRRIGRRVPAYNAAIARVAREEQVPLLNYWRSLQGPRVIHHGLGADGVHPQVLGGCRPQCLPLVFTRRGLRYGVNLRNLTALQALHKVRRVILEDGAPDPPPAG